MAAQALRACLALDVGGDCQVPEGDAVRFENRDRLGRGPSRVFPGDDLMQFDNVFSASFGLGQSED